MDYNIGILKKVRNKVMISLLKIKWVICLF